MARPNRPSMVVSIRAMVLHPRRRPYRPRAVAAASRPAAGSAAASAASAAARHAVAVARPSEAPTWPIAEAAIDSEVIPRPTSTQASNGSAAASPHTPTGLPTARPACAVRAMSCEHGRLPRVGEPGQLAAQPVDRHRVLRQVVGADRQEVDVLEDAVREQRRRRDLDHHAGSESALAHQLGEPLGLCGGRDHRRHHPRGGVRCAVRRARSRRAGGSAGRDWRSRYAARVRRGPGSPPRAGWRTSSACRTPRPASG